MVASMKDVAARINKIKSIKNFNAKNEPVLILTNPKFDSENSLTTLITFQNNGQFKKEDEGIPIMINEHPIGAITKVTDKLVQGYIINRYMGLEYSEFDGERKLSGICFGRPTFKQEGY